MSVMFALAGSLMAASLDRSGPAAVGRRLRRLLPSLWVLAAVFVPAMLFTGLSLSPRVLLWLFPIADPPANYWGALALSPIWYLRDYLWFVLASPVALWLFRRAPLPTLLAPYLLLVAIEVGIVADDRRWSRVRALLRRLAARLRPPRRDAAPAAPTGCCCRWRRPRGRSAAPGS